MDRALVALVTGQLLTHITKIAWIFCKMKTFSEQLQRELSRVNVANTNTRLRNGTGRENTLTKNLKSMGAFYNE